MYKKSIKFIVLVLLTIITINFLNAKTTTYKKEIPSIIDISWLNENSKNPNLIIVDVRSKEDFEISHIKNAVNIPTKEMLFDENFLMPKLDKLRELFSKKGIDHNSLIVIYDGGDFKYAARLYWILEVLGHYNVGLFKHGFNPYLIDKLPLSNVIEINVEKSFVPYINNEIVETKLSTLLAIGNKKIIDGRDKDHYDGKKSTAKRFGHIPTAMHYSFKENLVLNDNGNELKDIDSLKEVYKGLNKKEKIILYCNGGSAAALNYIVLKELGYKVSVYDGSWREWGNDFSLPISK